ncbi:hypothetical protein [Sphingomonas sp. UYP23]
MLFEALMAVAALVVPQTQAQRAAPVTAEGIFREGLMHWADSTTDAVVVTVIDRTTGAATEVCVGAKTLVFAVAGDGWVRVGRDSAHAITDWILASKDHLLEAGSIGGRRQCAWTAGRRKGGGGYIRRGVYAFRSDRPAILFVGQVRD